MHVLIRIKWFVILALLQGLVLNYAHIDGYGTPLLYIYFILKLDNQVQNTASLLWAFALGLLVDMLGNTPGLNTTALLWTALWRKNFLYLYSNRDADESYEPSIKAMGFTPFLLYVITATFLHAFILHSIDYFTYFHWTDILLKTLYSTLSTVLCILCLDAIRSTEK